MKHFMHVQYTFIEFKKYKMSVMLKISQIQNYSTQCMYSHGQFINLLFSQKYITVSTTNFTATKILHFLELKNLIAIKICFFLMVGESGAKWASSKGSE